MSKLMLRSKIRKVLGFGFIIPFLALITKHPLMAVILCFVMSCLFWATRIGETKSNYILEEISFQDKIKRRLAVEHVIIWMRKKPMKKVAFGGFAIPIVPIFISAGFNDTMNKVEVTIHELVHAHYFIYGFQSMVLYAFVAIVTSIRLTLTGLFLAAVTLICFMLFQEFITFNMTQRIAEEYGYKTRFWNRYTLIKYVIYYGFWFLLCATILVVYFVYSHTTALLLAVLGFIVFNRFMLRVASFFNRRDTQNKPFYKADEIKG